MPSLHVSGYLNLQQLANADFHLGYKEARLGVLNSPNEGYLYRGD